MRNHLQTQLAAARKNAGELLRRMAALAAVQAHADEVLAVRQGLRQRGESGLLTQVAQEAKDQTRADAKPRLCIAAGAGQAFDDRCNGHAAVGVGLRVEEEFGMHHPVGRGAFEVGAGHVEEVLLVQQHAGTGVVDVEKALQVAEGVGGAQRIDAGVAQRHAVALRELEDQLGLQRAFNVDVQFSLGHGAQQSQQARAGEFGHDSTWVKQRMGRL